MRILGCKIKLLILDVDGVLTKFYRIVLLIKEVAKESGLPDENVIPHFKKVRKGGYPLHFRFKDDVEIMWPNLNKEEISHFVASLRKKEKEYVYEAYEGVREFLHWLHRKGMILAICTRNSREALFYKLAQAGINKQFFSAVSVPGKYSKPDPHCVHSILETTRIKKENAVFVGDWFPDLNTARNAEVMFIGTTCGVLSRKAFIDAGVPKHCIISTLPYLHTLITE